MAETTTETLVRKVWKGAPDGQGVMRTEKVEVEITWPDGRPEQRSGYTVDGDWQIVEDSDGAD